MLIRASGNHTARRSRKHHQKVRTGCAICKARRVKCDQNQPTCDKCLLFGVECTYSDTKVGHNSESGVVFLVTEASAPQSRRGRPRVNWLQSMSKASNNHPLSAISPWQDHSLSQNSIESYNAFLKNLQWSDRMTLQICHQAIVDRCPTVVLSFSAPYIIDLIRAFVAWHIASMQPQHQSHFDTLAATFFSSGLLRFSKMLSIADTDNCHAVFVAAILVCMTTLARGPRQGEYLLFNNSGASDWVPLLRGIRAILDTFSEVQIFSGPLKQFACKTAQATQPTAQYIRLKKLDWVIQLNQLRNMVVLSHSATAADDLEVLNDLHRCFQAVTIGNDNEYRRYGINSLAFIWVYRLREDYVLRLRQKEALPLIIFAHFSVLLSSLQDFWFVSKWPQHILNGVSRALDPAYTRWLRWPEAALHKMSSDTGD